MATGDWFTPAALPEMTMSPVNPLLLAIAASASASAASSPSFVVQAMFDALNRHDADAVASLYADDALLVSSDFCANRRGRAEAKRTYEALFAAFPDIHDEVVQVVMRGDRVAVRFTARTDAGAPPLRLPISTFLTVRQGKIVSDESTFDTGGRPCLP